jgi:alpha-L-rhamnosidase
MARLYTKWLDDIAGNLQAPDWGGDQVAVARALYLYYGDERVLRRHYDVLQSYANLTSMKTQDHIVRDGFGDWVAPNEGHWEAFFHDVPLVNTALHHQQVRWLSWISAALGKPDHAEGYAKLADRIREAFDRHFWDEARGGYGDGSQTTSILPLAFDLVPDGRRQAVLKRLQDSILQEHDGHLDTGIFGTRYLVDVLADHGLEDLAYTVLTQQTYPGFGYQIGLGATTTWEQWSEKGPMHSHNHSMFAGVGTSFYTRFAGIRPLEPGYQRIAIRPVLPRGLQAAAGGLRTVRGYVSSSWKKDGDLLWMEVDVPVNCKATLGIPKLGRRTLIVEERGTVVWDRDRFVGGAIGIHDATQDESTVQLELGSGSYSFRCRPGER